jgi:hypothetical protein
LNEVKLFTDKKVIVEMTGNRTLHGKLMDVGDDLIVLFHQQQYLYIPLAHVHHLKADLMSGNDANGNQPAELPAEYQIEQITVAKMLNKAKGLFVEIHVSGNKPMSGYLTGILNDYIVVASPVYGPICVSLQHLKWLIPHPPSHTPYSPNIGNLSAQHSLNPFSQSFEAQCKQAEGQMVVFDIGGHSEKVGFIKKINSGIVDFADANGNSTFLNIGHVKTLYAPVHG